MRWEQLLGKDVFIVSTHLLGNDTLYSKEGMTPVSSLEKNPKHAKNLCPRLSCQGAEIRRGQAGFGEQNESQDFFCLLFMDDHLSTLSSISAPGVKNELFLDW